MSFTDNNIMILLHCTANNKKGRNHHHKNRFTGTSTSEDESKLKDVNHLAKDAGFIRGHRPVIRGPVRLNILEFFNM